MSLPQLPPEILISIFPLLPAADFLSLTRTNKALHAYADEHSFWRTRTTTDFRLPPQPLFETDGPRWHWLYRSLHTASEVYTWGRDDHGNLGRTGEAASVFRTDVFAGYPAPMERVSGPYGIGQIVDVQCGGWSTVLLNSRGKLFAAGVVDGERLQWQSNRGADASRVAVTMPMKPRPNWMFDVSHRIIDAFSMGRKRLLALTDHGEVIEWTMNFTVAGEVLSVDHLHPDAEYERAPRATMVVSGWAEGSAMYPGYGLYYWRNIVMAQGEVQHLTNYILNDGIDSNSTCVPGTRSAGKVDKDSIEASMGNVKKYIVLEHHIIILTNLDKLYSWKMRAQDSDGNTRPDTDNYVPTELTSLYPPKGAKVLDVQGSFRTFGVFSSDDSIFTVKLDEDDLENTPRFTDADGNIAEVALPEPEIKPELQSAGVVQLAFGDYHYHALHLNGQVSSYGRDSRNRGALGFGRGQISMLRGVSVHEPNVGDLLIPDQSDGRRTVWFEPEKFIFAATMLSKYVTASRDEAFRRVVSEHPTDFTAVYGEWFEQQGRCWESGPRGEMSKARLAQAEGATSGGNPTLPAYFPIKIAAAGWSSAAVVLIDSERAERVRQSYLLPKHQEIAANKQTETAAVQQDKKPVTWGEWLASLSNRLQSMTIGGEVDESATGSCVEAESYIWSEQDFPRLRLPEDDSLVQMASSHPGDTEGPA